ncbi:Gfo/Idh/MocA family oxidoreductase [Olivibacter sp. SDN3]|uniref:Gfo/Idh/MocA family protein n=1 Tax=Olivibacter sp. SDN3 TaxID=2764720 RepID=UPI0016518EC9|nr:Gfo/Idh/MocA family oxidoreductase [Olivibacter sp. SDN3]QNL49914.1 Gfo/Idh/MocA family oxidoreductase [Olivibacter sp. SDN3]
MERKEFIKKAIIGAAGITVLPRHVLGGQGFLAPSDRINLGYIGTGKQNMYLLGAINQCPETLVLAASDVDQHKLQSFAAAATTENKKKSAVSVAAYANYRELLERKDIDAVVIASPDHWHAQMVVDAAKAGKDIYCEKPLSLTVAEGRAMVSATKKYKRVFQTGSMQRSMKYFRDAVNLVRNGYIGQIREINVSIGKPVVACDLPTMPVPDYLDWNAWVGPSLYRGYHPTLAPPLGDEEWAGWRNYRGFGGGYVTDWGAHMFDIVQWALGMDDSGPVEFVPPQEPNAEEGLYFRYANGIQVNHKNWGSPNAIQFLGTDGTVEVAREFLRSSPDSLVEIALQPSDQKVYHSENHYQDWIDAIKKREKPIVDVETGHRTASVCNIVNIAYELQKTLKWDPKKEQFDNAYANMMLSRPYRSNWDFNDF